MRANKDLGQHFLVDQESVQRIVEASEVGSTDQVLEIGAGTGLLTAKLARQAGQVIALEIDSRMIPILENISGIKLFNQDFREFDLSSLAQGYKVIANLPYYMTSFVIRRLLEAESQPSELILLIQREVAQRIVAPQGQLSVLAIMVGYYADAEIIFDISPDKFSPPPRVYSSLIKIRPTKKSIQELDYQELMRLVKAGFSQKRKKLKNSLSSGLAQPISRIEQWLAEAGIDGNKRAQELGLEDWGRLMVAKSENTP
ncbi:ribosomal RNA small subunit methyltransferase A [Candidatus Saccharibacteria bacterium]|nr:ribosomal RNA small subunit methyltransferase A [Candidatus Saccharibacteria bacterium]MCB9834506.1 ribosomal RNA small subunit methyltransferase A [Candidatus Nomurabacteria bacterium]